MELNVFQVTLVGISPFGWEDVVVFTPKRISANKGLKPLACTSLASETL
jgi:hypothetical protein